MTLVDTSVWIDHFRQGEPKLVELLAEERVLCHPLVSGEIACDNLQERARILAWLDALPKAIEASQQESLQLLQRQGLHGKGLGWIDIQLLASSLMTRCTLWTKDKALARAAREIGLAAE